MGKALTEDINKFDKDEGEREPSSLAAFVKALSLIMSKEELDQKTQLSDRNIQGIMKLLTFNDHLQRNFGLRLKEIDILIAEKLIKTISLDRQGKDEILELFRAMKLELESGENVPTVGNRMIVQRR
jgi:hypothetical protein